MKSSFKVTLLIAWLSILTISLDASAQQIVPVKTGDVWTYQNESSGAVLYQNLEKAEPFRNGVGIARKNGKWGALDLSMKELVPFEYEEMEMILPTVIRAFKHKRFTLFSHEGKPLATNLSNALSAEVIPDAIVVSDENRKFGMLNSDGKTVIPMKYARAPEVVNENKLLLFVEKNKKFYQGVLDQEGKELVPFEYYSIRYREDGYYVGKDEEGKYHFHNVSGEEIFVGTSNHVRFFGQLFVIERFENEAVLHSVSSRKKVMYDRVIEFENVLIGMDSTKTTVYSLDGKSFSHKGMWRPQEKRDDYLLVVEYAVNPTNYAIWNEKGKVIIEETFGRVYAWNEKWMVVNVPEHQRKQVLFDVEKKKQVGVYDKVELLACNNLRVLTNGKTQLLNEELKELSQSEIDKKSVYINLTEADLQQVRRQYSYATKQSFEDAIVGDEDCGGRDLKEVKINNVRLIEDRYGMNPIPNRLVVRYWEDDKWKTALINFEGKIIAQGAFGISGSHMEELIQFVSYERLDVGAIGRTGLMDIDGQVILPARYDKIEELKGDTAIVALHGLWSIINIRTDEVILSGYHHIRSVNNDFYSIQKNGNQGIADSKGNVIVPAIYEKVVFTKDGSNMFEVERDKQKFYVDQNGNEIPRE